MTEIWTGIPGHEGAYEVSDAGRVRSLDRYRWRRPSRRHPDPAGWQKFVPGREIRLSIGSHGYLVFNLAGQVALLHRVMLSAFVGPCPSGQEALHDDDCKLNNTFPNLRWGTRSQNVRDAYRNGRQPSRKGKPRRALCR